MNEALIKDQILEFLSFDKAGNLAAPTSEDLAKKLKIVHYVVIYLIDKLEADKLVTTYKTSALQDLSGRIVKINHNGLTFLKFGGYKVEMKREQRQKVWVVCKIIAAALNSMLVLAIAYWGVQTQIEANSKSDISGKIIILEKEVHLLRSKIIMLEEKIQKPKALPINIIKK